MKQLEVKVDFKTNLRDLIEGFLFCTDNMDKIDDYIRNEKQIAMMLSEKNGKDFLTEKGRKLLQNNLIDNPNPHTQLFNQCQIRIQIKNTTRAVLQEFARHRISWEITVKSSRYALHKVVLDERIPNADTEKICFDESIKLLEEVVSDYYFIPENDFVSNGGYERKNWIENRFSELQSIKFYKLKYEMSNDKLKKYINDYMFTDINLVCSAQALRNFFVKRLSKRAFPQIRVLARMMYDNVPEEYRFLFKVWEWRKLDVIDFFPNPENAKIIFDKLPELYYKDYLIKE